MEGGVGLTFVAIGVGVEAVVSRVLFEQIDVEMARGRRPQAGTSPQAVDEQQTGNAEQPAGGGGRLQHRLAVK